MVEGETPMEVDPAQPDILQKFLPDWVNTHEKKVREILFNPDRQTQKKIDQINQLTGCTNDMKTWMNELVHNEIYLELPNYIPNSWTPETFNAFMLGLSQMVPKQAESFFALCMQWVVNKDWPDDYAIHLARKRLAKKGAKNEETPILQKLSLRDTVGRKSDGEDSEWLRTAKADFDKEITKDREMSGHHSRSLVNPESQRQDNILRRNSTHRISIESDPHQDEGDPIDAKDPKEELTIALIGGSGCGKTTLINSFNNYFRFPNFDKVMNKGVRVCIPTRFSTFKGDKQTTIQPKLSKVSGDQKNENLGGGGRSVTKEPITHTFKYKREDGTDVFVNFIDTPGMNDTEGEDVDDEHVKNIMAYLENLKKIDAICMVLKPNESKLTYSIRSALNKLLDRLPKSTYPNILFFFTYTNSTNFRPGETLPVLRNHFMETSRGIDMKQKNNIYCFDNEPFRYLCLIQSYPEEEDEQYTEKCKTTYDFNVTELTRMIEIVEKLPPFKFKALPKQSNKAVKVTKPPEESKPIEPKRLPQHREASPPPISKKEDVMPRRTPSAERKIEDVVQQYNPNAMTEPSTSKNTFPPRSIIEPLYHDTKPIVSPPNSVVPYIPSKITEERSQPGSSSVKKSQKVEEVGEDVVNRIDHPIGTLTKGQLFWLLAALVSTLARIIADTSKTKMQILDHIKLLKLENDRKSNIIRSYCEECGYSCLGDDFSYDGICKKEYCKHRIQFHKTAEKNRESFLAEISANNDGIQRSESDLAIIETELKLLQDTCIDFSLFRIDDKSDFPRILVETLSKISDNEHTKSITPGLTEAQKNFYYDYSIKLIAFTTTFQEKLVERSTPEYIGSIINSTVVERILQLMSLENGREEIKARVENYIEPNKPKLF